MASILQEVMGIESHNTGLIGLGNIGKDNIDHTDEHSVFQWVSSVFDNRNDIGSQFSNT